MIKQNFPKMPFGDNKWFFLYIFQNLCTFFPILNKTLIFFQKKVEK